MLHHNPLPARASIDRCDRRPALRGRGGGTRRFSCRLVLAGILLAAAAPVVCPGQDSPETSATERTSANPSRPPNVVFVGGPLHLTRVGEGLLCGAAPQSSADYDRLASLGVRTVVCVDASGSSREEANVRGWKYAHLPIDYGGITRDRIAQIAFVLERYPQPIYIHCHHGKHRAPAALAMGCVATGRMSSEAALSIMRASGTGRDYLGLWRCVAQGHPLGDLPARMAIPQRVEPQPIQTAMLHLQQHMEALETWANAPPAVGNGPDPVASPPTVPDRATVDMPADVWTPVARSLLVYEHLRELQVADDAPWPGYQAHLAKAVVAAEQLYRACLRANADFRGSVRAVRERCDACHQANTQTGGEPGR